MMAVKEKKETGMTNNFDGEHYWIIGLAILLVPVLLVRFAFFFNDFSRELRFLNNEIGRTTGHERKHWLRRRRRLWLSIIPFVKY